MKWDEIAAAELEMQDEVTLAEVLMFRDEKAAAQQKLRNRFPKSVILSLGMNIPGPVKTSPVVTLAFREGMKQLEHLLSENLAVIKEKIILAEHAGYAAVYCIEGIDAAELKKYTIVLETTHVLGRLYDLDVCDEQGQAVSREQAGIEPRRCLLCGNDAKVCGRSRTHTVLELQKKVFGMLVDWKEQQNGL